MNVRNKIGFGGGCHWCTEAVFQSLRGVEKVEQGYISSVSPNDSLSEGVIVHYNPTVISLEDLIEIHLYTHKSTSKHSMRDMYRSAVYYFEVDDSAFAKACLSTFQSEFEKPIITQALPFESFKASRQEITDYYSKNPEKPFCKRYIAPKLQLLLRRFGKHYKNSSISS